MTLETALDVFYKIVIPLGSVLIGFAMWLDGRFNRLERLGERRHRQNLIRFARIGEKLEIENFMMEDMNDHP